MLWDTWTRETGERPALLLGHEDRIRFACAVLISTLSPFYEIRTSSSSKSILACIKLTGACCNEAVNYACSLLTK